MALPNTAVQNLSKRKFLVASLGAAAMATSLFTGERGRPLASGGDGLSCLVFDVHAVAVLMAVAEAVLPADGVYPDLRAQVIRRLDEELSFVPAVAVDVNTAIDLVQYLPLASGHLSRFTALDRTARQDVLVSAGRSSLSAVRAAASGLRMLVHFVYYGHEASWQAMGYDGPFAGVSPQASEQRRFYAQQVRRGSGQ